MIIRVFRANVHEGKQAEFESFFFNTAVPLLRQQPGLVGLEVGTPYSCSPTEFLMTTTWKDLESLRGFAGDQWEQAVIVPEEEHLLKEVSVHHYESAELSL